jgi:hypothetical protein
VPAQTLGRQAPGTSVWLTMCHTGTWQRWHSAGCCSECQRFSLQSRPGEMLARTLQWHTNMCQLLNLGSCRTTTLAASLASLLAVACSGATTFDETDGAGGERLEAAAGMVAGHGEADGADTGGSSGDPDEQVRTDGCTLILLDAVAVSVRDAAGNSLSAAVSAQVDGGQMVECWERARGEYGCYEQGGGTYVVTAQVGDQSQTASLELESDGCHVTTTETVEFVFE